MPDLLRHEWDDQQSDLSPVYDKQRRLCPDCHGTTLNLAHPDDGGTCPHCFGGYLP